MTYTSKAALFGALLCVWMCANVALAAKVQDRIVGGKTSNINQAPYLVNLRYDGTFYCGGSLVTAKHVVTAAHCVKGKDVRSITVHGGDTLLSNNGVSRTVARAFVPRAFSLAKKNMDVAVLKLSAPMNGSNIGTIGLCNTNLRVGQLISVFGWGLTQENGRAASNVMRSVKVPMVAKSRCTREYRSRIKLTDTMLCAGAPGRDSCSGDSGGPAVVNNHLCGIVSFGVGCARPNYPGVYTKVQNNVKYFILNAIKQ